MSDRRVKITNDSPISNKALLTVNGEILPFYSADIHLEAGEFVTMTIRTRADYLDIQALEQNTEIIIKDEREEHDDAKAPN